ncbi:mechanosensitive ion channel [Xanthomonas hyacinthi]|uniref:Small-conductance mechanosensitive channel n=1 Tax=Xanthomonas hyacinthi TaxID=56455 RepID=A0A2S7EZH7_9XANT|nr:mechanosensitive ion channel domain-containing protein [Xanthomonas hyacinthi]PPU98462.1 mechanosensitive ion channel protein MscS [Xanthomonas hyacinthi]QGY75135.1 mechanosensitive ion channel [Xanthomonas hyacinthi]
MSAPSPATATDPALWQRLSGNMDWEQLFATWGIKIAAALAVLLVGLWLSRWLANLLPKAMGRVGVDMMLTSFLRNVAYAVGIVVVVIAALGTVGVNTASLLAVIGAAGLAIGLALKDSLSNIASGVMLVTLRPFRVGDVVTIAGQTGTVEAVRIFQTLLSGADRQSFTIPNNLITASPIVNLTAQPTRRVELVIGIGYQDDLALARQVALDIMKADPRVLPDPAPDVVVYELGANSVNLGIRCYVMAADWFGVKVALLEQIKLGFDRAKISIAYPQKDTHLYLHDKDGAPLRLDALARNATALPAAGDPPPAAD